MVTNESIWKQFRRDGKLVETRLLMKVYPADGIGSWWHIAYAWLDDESDAVATAKPISRARGTAHQVPSTADCERCHSNVADVVIGVSAIQLSTSDGHGALSSLVAAGRLTVPPAREFSPPGTGAVQDTLGYLHGNCGHCHNDSDMLASVLGLRLRLSVNDSEIAQTGLYRSIGHSARHDMPGVGSIEIASGQPDQSQMFVRMTRRDQGWQMPPLCTKATDPTGMALVHDWIAALPH